MVVSVPSNIGEFSDATIVAGMNLIDFLRFGLRQGYFQMEQIAYQRDRAFKAYLTDDPLPESEWEAVDPEERQILDYLAKSLAIAPVRWSVLEFETMQSRVLPHLRFEAQ